MKHIKLAYGMLAFLAFLTFSACQKDDAIEPEFAAVESEFTTSEYQLDDLKAFENTNVTGATETTDFRISNSETTNSDRNHLSFILRKLDLSENQKSAVKGFVKDYAVCKEEHCRKVHEIHRELLRKANAIREDYIKAYRAGRITKAELEQKISTLREKVREEINKHEQKQMHVRIIRKCRMELFSNIESVLNREQLQLWNRWKHSL